jgi:S1-C subfamily serine protease
VDRTGPHNDGEGPEDSDSSAPGPEDEAAATLEDEEIGLLGWVPPEERLWRHPSELSSPSAARPGVVVAGRPAPRSRDAWISALVGAGAAAIVVVAGLFMASPRPAGLTSAPEGSSNQPRSASRSLVALLATGSSGTTVDCAVAVAPGGLVATTADALAGATSVDAWRQGRWVPATIVGTDSDSDVGLVRVPFDLPVAQFTDETTVTRGARVWTMGVTAALLGSRDHGAAWRASLGTVSAADTAVNGPRGQGMPGIVVVSTLDPDTTGGVLVSADGSVLGIQDTSVDPGGTDEVFLPADLVVGVSADLAADGRVSHGWLGINGGNAGTPTSASPSGAVVDAVDPAGPAAASLQQGDVIVAVDDTPVHSMADLRSRLYMLPAGWPVWLRVYRHNRLTTVEVDLGSSP